MARTRKGKPCGASYIAANKICRVGMPDSAQKGLDKAVVSIKKAGEFSPEAKSFDDSFHPSIKVKGEAKSINWEETVNNGKTIGKGTFAFVTQDPEGKYVVKRGEVSNMEANIIKKVGDKDLGPRLLSAERESATRTDEGSEMARGRIAMTKVPGEQLPNGHSSTLVSGDKLGVEVFWEARAALHREGIAHNDMHPGNVLVDDKGKARFVDFGLAQDSPKAALSEAMGAFARMGNGDWQAKQWPIMGAAQLTILPEGVVGKYPKLGRVMMNKKNVLKEMKKDGLDKEDVQSVVQQKIRTPMEEYGKGVWAKMSDEQAMKYINMLYDGV